MTDPFTGTVIEAALEAAASEMFDVIRKTAMSPIIYEVLDVGTGVTDAHGSLVSSGAGIPSFVGVLDKSVKAIILKMGDSVSEGDIFVTNDPNHGGVTHLNDVVIAEPVFAGAQCIAWVASIAHWSDVGGRTPGSMAIDVTQIIAEGLRLPIVRLFDKGIRNAALFDIIRCNSRLPDFAMGDLWAQVAAGRRAARLIREVCKRYGQDAMNAAIERAYSMGKQRALDGLSNIPKGRYCIEEPQDNGTPWKITITIDTDQFVVDLRDAPRQSEGPHNTSRDGAVIACQMLFKALTDPERFANAGSFAPLTVLTREGTIFHADASAAHAYYFETRIRLFDAMWHCLAQAMPERLPAGHFASIFGTVIAGSHPDTQRAYTMVEPQMGGWGATATRDGQSAMFSTSHGDTYNCPVEIAEARYGFTVVEKRLAEPDIEPRDGAEASDEVFNGGRGIVLRYQMRSPATLSAGCSHARVPVWSIGQSTNGSVNCLTVHRASGQQSTYAMVSGLDLESGDIVEIKTANGGSVSGL